MKNLIKKISLSTIAILFVMTMFGALITYRTVRKKISDIRNGSSLYSVIRSFNTDFEQYAPRGKYYNKMLFYSTGIINSDQVIFGKNNWLFYNSIADGDPLGDYTGKKDYTEKELYNTFTNIREIQNTLKERNIDFCLLIAPNKENIYADYMPEKYPHVEITRTDKLIDYLNKHGIIVADPKSELQKYSEKYDLYYKNDTHWNQLGAYIGVEEVLRCFKYNAPTITPEIVQKGNELFSDLLDITKLKGAFTDDYGNCTEYCLNYREFSTIDDKNLTLITNEDALYNKKILIIGDSFRTAMQSSICYFFKNVYVVHRNDYIPSMINEIKPDYLVLEFVERYSDRIVDFSI